MPFPKTDEELLMAGYRYEGSRRCLGPTCGAYVAWYRTPRNKRIPLNPGTLEPHFATCPDVKNFLSRKAN